MISTQSLRRGKKYGSAKNQRRPVATKQRRRLQRNIEQLESRQLLASLAGEVWADTNVNGIRDTGESAVIDARVFIDSNDDGRFTSDEPFTRTDSVGQYAFAQVAAGSHVVRVELQSGQSQTSPLTYYGTTTVPGGIGSDTQFFRMTPDGTVSLIGGSSQQTIDGLVETSSGTLIGLNSHNETFYAVSRATGAVAPLATAGVDLQSGLAYDAETNTVYATAVVGGSLQLLTVDQISGVVSTPDVSVQELQVSNFGSTFFNFDLNSETSTELPRSNGFFSSTLDARSDGAVFGLQGRSVIQYSVLPTGTSGRLVSTLSRPIDSISFGANDQLFGVSSLPSSLHRIDPLTGNVTDDVPITFNGASISGVAGFDIAADGTHYLVDSTHLYTFDPVSGVATQAANPGFTPFSSIFTSLSVGADGSLFATLFNSTTPIASIDPATGVATALGNDPVGAPYSAVIAGDSLAVPSPIAGTTASDLAFDPIERRIVGFDDTADRFFAFDTLGRGTLLANSQRPLNGSTLSFGGSGFVMFDADDPTGTSVIQVNPDTGQIEPRTQASIAVEAQALDFSTRESAHRVTVDSSQDVIGLNFGLAGELNRPAIGDGLFINELVIGPLFEDRDAHQAIELRGAPSTTIGPNTYLVAIQEDGFSPGNIQGVFDLSNQSFGANGFLVMLPQDSPYAANPLANVLRSSATGFSGLPGNIYTSDNADGSLAERIGSSGYFLLQSDVAPVVGADVDVNDDGVADPDGLMNDWSIFDSIALHPFVGRGAQTYADIVFVERGTGDIPELTRREGVPQIVREGIDYAARIGDSIGSEVDDWVVGTAIDVSDISEPFQLGLEDGIFGVPIPLAFKGRNIDHFGESNFVGGVRGTVSLTPLIAGEQISEPASGVTVLADTNGNARRDSLTFQLNPDNFAVGDDLTNVLPGVTLTTNTPGLNNTGSTGFEIEPVAESFFNPQGNRIFSHSGIGFFNEDSRHFRADFYRPANSVSIVGISAGSSTFMRLDAYDVNGNLIGSDTSRALNGPERERLSVSFTDDVIAYAEAYSLNDFTDANGVVFSSSPFGKLDDFGFSQFEAVTQTNDFGEYELTNLIPDNYQITFLNSPTNRDLLGAQRVPLTIQRYENFILRPNLTPVTSDLEITIAENTAPGTVVGQITGTDDDGAVGFSLLDGQDLGIDVDAVTGQLTVAANADLNFESTPSFHLTVAVTDLLGAVTPSVVSVTLTDVNEAPVIQAVSISANENTAVGTTIGRIIATDPDTMPDDQRLTYTVIGGTGANTFALNPDTGTVSLASPDGLNFEQTPELTLIVRVSDNGVTPQTATQVQTIAITNANDAPQLIIPNLSIPENSTGIIGTLGVDDQDLQQQHFFQVDGGNGRDFFEVLADGSIAVRSGTEIDFETNTAFQLDVTVVDSGVPALTDRGTITITVLDVNEPATLTFDRTVVGENAVAGDLVTRIDVTDAEGAAGNSTVTLLNELDGGLFELRPLASTNPAISELELVVREGAQFDFETAATLRLVFQVDDQTGSSSSARVERTITVANQNDPPTVVTRTISVSEAALSGVENVLATLRFADVDPNETLTARIVGGTGANQFALDTNTFALSLIPGAVLDADVADPTLTLDIEVTDSVGAATTATVEVRLNNVNEAPIFRATLEPFFVSSGQDLVRIFDDNFVSDPEGGQFQLSVFDDAGSLPPWVRFDRFTRSLTISPSPENVGNFNFTLRAFELGSTSFNDLTFSVDVEPGELPLHNRRDRFDVDNSRSISPNDILAVINYLQSFGPSSPSANAPFLGFVDVSGNGIVTPLDILLVIEGLAAQSAAAAQGELTSFLDSDREDAVDEAFAQFDEPSLF